MKGWVAVLVSAALIAAGGFGIGWRARGHYEDRQFERTRIKLCADAGFLCDWKLEDRG